MKGVHIRVMNENLHIHTITVPNCKVELVNAAFQLVNESLNFVVNLIIIIIAVGISIDYTAYRILSPTHLSSLVTVNPYFTHASCYNVYSITLYTYLLAVARHFTTLSSSLGIIEPITVLTTYLVHFRKAVRPLLVLSASIASQYIVRQGER